MLDTRLQATENKFGFMHIDKDRVNWDYLYDTIRQQYGSVSDFSKNVLKYDGSYLSKCKNGKQCFHAKVAEAIVKALKVKQECLFPELAEMPPEAEPQKTTPAEESFDLADLESDFEKSVRQRLDDIETKLDMVLELESKINTIHLNLMNLMEQMPKRDPAKEAEEILREFVVARGRGGKACEFKPFQEELDRRNVGRSYARDALNRVGATLEATGYGKDKTMWVIMPEVQDV